MSEEQSFDDYMTWLEEAQIHQQMRDGVSFSLDWKARSSKVTAIHWRREFDGIPADRNALAEEIIGHVETTEMPLDLDGNKYLIRKVGE